jgi:hypothetical protein
VLIVAFALGGGPAVAARQAESSWRVTPPLLLVVVEALKTGAAAVDVFS